jgi:hypothetical protein
MPGAIESRAGLIADLKIREALNLTLLGRQPASDPRQGIPQRKHMRRGKATLSLRGRQALNVLSLRGDLR